MWPFWCLTAIFLCWILGVVTFTFVLPCACKPCFLCSLAPSPKDLILASHKSKAYWRNRIHHSSSSWGLKSPSWWHSPPQKLCYWALQHPRSSGTLWKVYHPPIATDPPQPGLSVQCKTLSFWVLCEKGIPKEDIQLIRIIMIISRWNQVFSFWKKC